MITFIWTISPLMKSTLPLHKDDYMKMQIYTCMQELFGRLCASWKIEFDNLGHNAEVLELPRGYDGILPCAEDVDINLLIGGVSMFFPLVRSGFPKHGRHVLWMFEPLPADDESQIHAYKRKLFDAICRDLNAVICIDPMTLHYVGIKCPSVLTAEIPYTINPQLIRAPLPERERNHEIIHVGLPSPRRKRAQLTFLESGVPARFIYDGCYGDVRSDLIAKAKMCLHIHRDEYRYFCQHRILEAWSLGVPVVSEESGCLKHFGVTPGSHLVVCQFEDLRDTCARLLANIGLRNSISKAARELLLQRYCPSNWIQKMLHLFAQVLCV
jgi:glycosyltransferase involved in cell wall biosynthesis